MWFLKFVISLVALPLQLLGPDATNPSCVTVLEVQHINQRTPGYYVSLLRLGTTYFLNAGPWSNLSGCLPWCMTHTVSYRVLMSAAVARVFSPNRARSSVGGRVRWVAAKKQVRNPALGFAVMDADPQTCRTYPSRVHFMHFRTHSPYEWCVATVQGCRNSS